MAETVGLHVESMIPELEQMKRIGLFTPEEIQEIIKKRKEFEYKISRTMKEKQDFLQYINFEVKLLRQIKLRRDKIKMSDKKSEIEYALAKKVVKIYQLLLSYFKSDVRMWISYINFCTQTRFTNVVSQAFQQMLQVHSDKKHLWVFAAKWELTESNNLEGALNYLKTGLHHHPDSQELYIEAFRLELQSATIHPNEISAEEIKEKEEKAVRRASVHFKVAINAIGNDIEFVINLLNIATEFRYTEDLQKEIIDFLTKNCWKDELMWHTMAQRELNGFTFDRKDRHKNTTKLCLAVYKSAVKVLPTQKMWEKFLDTLIEISRDEKRKNSIEKKTIEEFIEEGFNGDFLKERHFIFWLEGLKNDHDNKKDPKNDNFGKYEEILKKSTEKIPQSVELWLVRLNHYCALDNESEVRTIFDLATRSLGPAALQIYRSLIKYYQLKTGPTVFDRQRSIFEQGIASSYLEISLPLRPQYVEWLSTQRNLKFARTEYEKMAQSPPFCLELHKKMIELELSRFNPSIPIVRNIFKRACQQFGKEKVEIWIDFIKFERNHGDAGNVSSIYNQAKNSLNENLVSVFTTDFAILNTQ